MVSASVSLRPTPRKLGAGYVTLPQMTGRRVVVIPDPLWRLRTTGLQNDLRLPGTTRLRVRSPWRAAVVALESGAVKCQLNGWIGYKSAINEHLFI